MVDLRIPLIDGGELNMQVEENSCLYILGPNGTGKSTLLNQWARSIENTIPISGSREIVFRESSVALSAAQAQDFETNYLNQAKQEASRYQRSFHNNENWLKRLIFKLKSRGDYHNERYVHADRAGNAEEKERLFSEMPLDQVNRAFAAAMLPLKLHWGRNSELRVTKDGAGQDYEFNQMSDGERAAFIIASEAILADDGHLILLDEPERHLHRSISAPLLAFLRQLRPKISWVVATHDLTLPRADPYADAVILYNHAEGKWRAELVTDIWRLSSAVSEAIYGARDRVLFIEGDVGSLDLPLYALMYPNVTIIPAGSCREVINACIGLSSAADVHYMDARGIVDQDNQPEFERLAEKGVFPLPFYAIESIYYHPLVLEAMHQTAGTTRSLQSVLEEACASIRPEDIDRLSLDAAYKSFVVRYQANVPSFDLFSGDSGEITTSISPQELIIEKKQDLDSAVENSDWGAVVRLFKIKAIASPKKISAALGFANRGAFEIAVRKKLHSDIEFAKSVKALLPTPFEEPDPTS